MFAHCFFTIVLIALGDLCLQPNRLKTLLLKLLKQFWFTEKFLNYVYLKQQNYSHVCFPQSRNGDAAVSIADMLDLLACTLMWGIAINQFNTFC